MKNEEKFNATATVLSVRTESDYLLLSNKRKVKDLVLHSELEENDIIDSLISLHLVLEVGLNTFYRHLALNAFKKEVDLVKVMENIDSISFIDKTVLFIYNSKFNFGDKISEASHYHGIIGTLKDFTGIRNKLFHGHSVSSIFQKEKWNKSTTKESLNLWFLGEQIRKFRFILDGVRFYFDCLETSWTDSGKDDLSKQYLDHSFLPGCHFESD